MEEIIEIVYQIKMNKGTHAGKIIFIEVSLDKFDYDSLVTVLLERGYIESWCNNNEFEVINRRII